MKKLFILAMLVPSLLRAEVVLIDDGREAHPWLKQNIEDLNRKVLNISERIPVEVRPCGQVNAYYDPAARQIVMCSEFAKRSHERYDAAVRGGVDKQSAAQAALGETVFVLMHELGHALIDINKIPVLGGQENAADMFAAYVLMKNSNVSIYFGGLNFFAKKPGGGERVSDERASDVHGLASQRRANLACWGYGKSPQDFESIIRYQRMAPQRIQGCQKEYEDMRRDVEQSFRPVLRISGRH